MLRILILAVLFTAYGFSQDSYTEVGSRSVTPTSRAQLPQPVLGGLQFFTIRGDFDAAVPAQTNEAFPSSIVGANNICTDFTPLMAGVGDMCFSSTDLTPGWVLTAIPNGGGVRGGGEDYAFLTSGFLGVTNNAIGANTFTDSMTLDFPTPVNGVGFDLIGDIVGPVGVTLNIYGSSGLLGSTSAIGSSTGTFWGVLASEPITQIEFIDQNGTDAPLISNLVYGNGSVVEIPTLGTYGLLGFVLILMVTSVVFIRRRKMA
ncbi:MAG: hypothetical protein KDC71_01525 [Acidobacteria bacterium]|nr:hypothetical protein [Acidobacteriota bacterium]